MCDLSEDIIELQTRVQFQDDTIQKLDDALVAQGHIVERLRRRIDELEDRLEQLRHERQRPTQPLDEKPPHY